MDSFDLLVHLLGGGSVHKEWSPTWGRIVRLADKHKLILPLAEALAGQTSAPQALRDELSNSATQKSLLEIHRSGHLLALIEQFQKAGIEVKTFKGPALAELAHGRVSARECIDLDLLVKPRDFQRALQLLFDSGFEYEMEDLPRCYSRFNYGVPLKKDRNRLTVDLHYKLFSEGVEFPMEAVWAEEHEVQIQGRSVATFSPELCFVYLALHGSKHCWRQLRWLHDLHALLPSVREDKLRNFAIEQRCEKSVALAFSLLQALWGSRTPPSFKLDESSLTRESLAYLRGETPTWPQYHRYQYRCQNSLRQRARLFLHTWFGPQIHDLKWVDLPPELWFVYYALRPLRVLGEAISAKVRTI